MAFQIALLSCSRAEWNSKIVCKLRNPRGDAFFIYYFFASFVRRKVYSRIGGFGFGFFKYPYCSLRWNLSSREVLSISKMLFEYLLKNFRLVAHEWKMLKKGCNFQHVIDNSKENTGCPNSSERVIVFVERNENLHMHI